MGFDQTWVGNAFLHRSEVIVFVDQAPIHTAFQVFFQHHIKPDAHAPAIPFHKRVCDIHFKILFNDLVKVVLRHRVDFAERTRQKTRSRKLKAAFGDILCSDLPGEVIQTAKQVAVDLLQAFCASNFDRIQEGAFEEGVSLRFTLLINAFLTVGKQEDE